jgi:hypothetical protein
MSYIPYHSAWSATDEPTGAALNHIESQWTAIKADADSHNHDLRYYLKATADTTFFSLTYFNNFDADKLDGSHLSDIVSAIMPIGAVLVWSGTDATIPSGWHICDGGTYGGYVSPDLRDRFVIGAGGSYAVGTTGGPVTWNGTVIPTGAVTIGAHTLTTTEIPSHTHSYTEYYNDIGAYNYYTANWPVTTRSTAINNQDEGGGGSHGHVGSTAAFSTVDPRPPWYALYYIMRYA